MNKFSPRYQNRLIIFFVCVPLWTASLSFLGSFLFSVKTEEMSIIIAIAVVISILYSQWSSIILKNQSLVISYISGGIPYRHVVSVNQIENIHIYYKKNLSANQIGNYFISVQYFDRKLKFSLAPYTRSEVMDLAKNLSLLTKNGPTKVSDRSDLT